MDGMAPHDADAPQLRTLLLTDLCDSTGLVEKLGDGRAAALFRDHDRLVLELQQRWRGRLIDRSDGLLLLFERPLDGLGFALDYRRGLDALGQAHRTDPLLARAGLHVGEVLLWRNSDEAVSAGAKPVEVEGLAKPFAARLMQLARPGQILLSSVAEPLVRRAARELGERGEALQWRTHGRWYFKGVPEVQEVHEVGEPGLAPLRMPRGDGKARRDLPLWRRPVALAAEAVLVAGVAVGVWVMTRPEPAIAFSERDWVVLGDMRNLTGQSVLDDSLEQAFRISLEQSRYVNVLSDLKVRDTLARMERAPDGIWVDRATGSEVALRDGARLLILPTVAEVGGRVRVSAEVVDPQTQRTLLVEKADGRGMESVLSSVDAVTASLRDALGEALTSINRDSAPLPRVTTKNLDALRAYALGQDSYGKSKFDEARGFYERAIELDPDFALAYIGLVRAYNALADLPAGMRYLVKARSLRERLPPREQLYLDAWDSQVNAAPDEPGNWMQLAKLYPDFFSASANAGHSLFSRNEYEDALPYAMHATSEHYEFEELSQGLLGYLRLALEDHAGAGEAFRSAGPDGRASAKVGLAITEAVQRRFDAVDRLWTDDLSLRELRFDRTAMYLDAGRWQDAADEARKLAASSKGNSLRSRGALLPLAVTEWALDSSKKDAAIERAANAALDAVADPDAPKMDAADACRMALYVALLAQRNGQEGLAERIIGSVDQQKICHDNSATISLASIARAGQLNSRGMHREAISALEGVIDGNEPLQAHVVLMEALSSAGLHAEALAQANWLAGHRGRAYAEHGCSWCQQPLNVYDTVAAHLRAAEVLSAMNRREDALLELNRFDRMWSHDTLPPHLRVRREAVLATFN